MATAQNDKRLLYKVLGVFAGVVFTIGGLVDRNEINHLKAVGKPAIVEPISGYTEHKSRGSRTYTAEFSFKTESGAQITKSTSFPQAVLDDIEAGQPVKVFYDPSNPYDFTFEKAEASWLLIGGGVAFAVAAIIFV